MKKRLLSPMEQVFDAPADFNRKTRRSARLLSSIWRWDMGPKPATAPRYARRHWDSDTMTHPKTRRQRRIKARLVRSMKGQA